MKKHTSTLFLKDVNMEYIKFIRDTPLECPYMPNRKFGVGDWIGGVASAAGSLFNGFANIFGTSKTNDANKDINEAQINYSREAFEKQKEYNNWLLGNQKQYQMADAKASGLNPSFASDSATGGMSSSPSISQPNQIPMDYRFDASPFANAGVNAMNFLLGKQELAKKSAETELTVAQKDKQLIENEILPNLLKSQVSVNLSNVSVNGQNIALSKKSADKISTEILQINKQMQQIDVTMAETRQRIAVMNQEEKIQAAQAAMQTDIIKAQIRSLISSSKLSETQARDIMATQTARIFNLNADTVLKQTQQDVNRSTSTLQGAQYENVQQSTVESKARTSNIAEDTRKKNMETELVYWNVQQNKLDFEIDKDFKRTERGLQMAKTTAETAKAAADAAKSTVDAIKPW